MSKQIALIRLLQVGGGAGARETLDQPLRVSLSEVCGALSLEATVGCAMEVEALQHVEPSEATH